MLLSFGIKVPLRFFSRNCVLLWELQTNDLKYLVIIPPIFGPPVLIQIQTLKLITELLYQTLYYYHFTTPIHHSENLFSLLPSARRRNTPHGVTRIPQLKEYTYIRVIRDHTENLGSFNSSSGVQFRCAESRKLIALMNNVILKDCQMERKCLQLRANLLRPAAQHVAEYNETSIR